MRSVARVRRLALLLTGGCGAAASLARADENVRGPQSWIERRRSEYKYVIAGGGTAARAAAEEVRRGDAEGTLLVVAPWWPGLIDGELAAGQKIDMVDACEKTVKLNGGDTVKYDRLLLAVGGEARFPPLGKVVAKGARAYVGGVRSAGDRARALRVMADAKGKGDRAHMTVVGGGWMALASGAELVGRGADVTFVYAEPAFLARHVPKYLSTELRRRLATVSDGGTDYLSYAAIRGVIEGSKNGEVEVVAGLVFERASGVQFRTDRVLLAPTTPEAAWIDVPALERRAGAFAVNRELSAASDVYAAGACALAAGSGTPQWSEAFARASGIHAARNMLGAREPFTPPRHADIEMRALRARIRVVGDADGDSMSLGYFNVARNTGEDTCGGMLRGGVLFFVTQQRAVGSSNQFSVSGALLWDGTYNGDEEMDDAALDRLEKILDAEPKERPALEDDLDEFACKYAGVLRKSEERAPEVGRVLWRRLVAARNVRLPKEEIMWMEDDPNRDFSSPQSRKSDAYAELLRRSAGER